MADSMKIATSKKSVRVFELAGKQELWRSCMLTPVLPVPVPPPEQRAFVAGIERHVKRMCHQWRISGPDVEDLVQESLAEIVASVQTFKPDKGDFETWARGVARNVIRHYLRDTTSYLDCFSPYHPNIEELPSSQPSPERCAQRAQARYAIVNAAETGKSQQMQVVALHAIEGMSHKDIGLQLHISPTNSEKCYFRGLTHLAECLDSELLSAMPPFVTGCDDEAVSTTKTTSRWFERSHYAGQIVAGVLALLSLTLIGSGPNFREKFVQNSPMSQLDKLSGGRDEPVVLRDTPTGKPEPASLPSVPVVSAPTVAKDKPTYVDPFAPLPPFKPTERTSSHRPRGR